jgi:hypothetical protein
VSRRGRQFAVRIVIPKTTHIDFTSPGLEIKGVELIIQNKAEWRKLGCCFVRKEDEETRCNKT